ncbi:uncharacterized protein PRCAT00005305001 [Priceomyces carsonii]|uniref:uncharacterized protein n=1 Tax=Priceomyces carsonii TaxID=28549 RepID=UPI002ED81AD6|nr:unnamed protein product [Priceomyces carsonii]
MVNVSESKKERLDQISTQLWQAGFTGMLKGTLIGLVTGYYFSYKYNRGPNTRFFKTPYKFWYLICWNVVGIIFETDVSKAKISKQIALEEDLKRNAYFRDEWNREVSSKKTPSTPDDHQ